MRSWSKIPASERVESVVNLDPSNDLVPVERALGVEWNVDEDEFQFRVKISQRPMTRRGILSTVASIYDPLGY